MTVNPPETRFKESRPFRINRMTTPKDKTEEIRKDFTTKIKVKVEAIKKVEKNKKICKGVARVKEGG